MEIGDIYERDGRTFEVINKGYIAYLTEKGYFIIGELRKEKDNLSATIYTFDTKKELIDKLPDYGEEPAGTMIMPSLDIAYGYYQRHSRVPSFIRMRTVDPRRGDIDRYLEKYNLKFYNRFEMLLCNEGRSLDNWRVLRDLNRPNIINQEDFK